MFLPPHEVSIIDIIDPFSNEIDEQEEYMFVDDFSFYYRENYVDESTMVLEI